MTWRPGMEVPEYSVDDEEKKRNRRSVLLPIFLIVYSSFMIMNSIVMLRGNVSLVMMVA
jgi:hypothetical protein